MPTFESLAVPPVDPNGVTGCPVFELFISRGRKTLFLKINPIWLPGETVGPNLWIMKHSVRLHLQLFRSRAMEAKNIMKHHMFNTVRSWEKVPTESPWDILHTEITGRVNLFLGFGLPFCYQAAAG